MKKLWRHTENYSRINSELHKSFVIDDLLIESILMLW